MLVISKNERKHTSYIRHHPAPGPHHRCDVEVGVGVYQLPHGASAMFCLMAETIS